MGETVLLICVVLCPPEAVFFAHTRTIIQLYNPPATPQQPHPKIHQDVSAGAQEPDAAARGSSTQQWPACASCPCRSRAGLCHRQWQADGGGDQQADRPAHQGGRLPHWHHARGAGQRSDRQVREAGSAGCGSGQAQAEGHTPAGRQQQEVGRGRGG